MDSTRRDLILRKLDEVFNSLERKTTDEAGWIALSFSVSRAKAVKLIQQAREDRQ